jgi:hypothetical protein
MMRTGIIFQFVLDELETGNANRIKRQVIGTARIFDGECFCAQLIKRSQPTVKDGSHLLVTLQVYSPDLSAAIVQVVISSDLLMLRHDPAPGFTNIE